MFSFQATSIVYIYLLTPLHEQDMTQGECLVFKLRSLCIYIYLPLYTSRILLCGNSSRPHVSINARFFFLLPSCPLSVLQLMAPSGWYIIGSLIYISQPHAPYIEEMNISNICKLPFIIAVGCLACSNSLQSWLSFSHVWLLLFGVFFTAIGDDILLLCFGLVMSLRCFLFLTCHFSFSSLILYRWYSNFSMTVVFFQYWFLPYDCTATWSPFPNSVRSWAFLSQCFFCCCFAFHILIFVSFPLNLDRNFFIVGNTLPSCFPKNLSAWDILVDFDDVLVNSSMARQGSLFSLIHFLLIYFICFTADSAIPLEFGISDELGFHLNLYLWVSSLIIWLSNSAPRHHFQLLECHISWSVSLSILLCNLIIFLGFDQP